MSDGRSSLAGTRIRERRIQLGLKQAELARRVNVSASYLNLIEHNRRRIGGKLMLDLAEQLEADPTLLADGATVAAVQGLSAAAAKMAVAATEAEQIDEFANRFPGWAALITTQSRRIEELEHTIATLSDRLAHDPHLSTSLHDVISMVTAIRSSAAILNETPDLEPEWRARFQRSVFEESERLVEGSQQLVSFLEGAGDVDQTFGSPREELEAFLSARGFHFAELEGGRLSALDDIIAESSDLKLPASRTMARDYLNQYISDAQALPLDRFASAAQGHNFEPGGLAAEMGVDLITTFRRLATLPISLTSREIGLAICDGSGALTYSKPIEGFSLPRLGAACALWPLYQSLARPMAPLRQFVEMPGEPPQRFLTHSVSQPVYPTGFEGPPVVHAGMLITAAPSEQRADHLNRVGVSCPICPRENCPARREPPLIASGFDRGPAIGNSTRELAGRQGE